MKTDDELVKNGDHRYGKVCAIAAHGASPSSDDNAASIQAALTECRTGGTVFVTGGKFKSGPLFITGVNVSLNIEEGASLVAAFGPQHAPITKSVSEHSNSEPFVQNDEPESVELVPVITRAQSEESAGILCGCYPRSPQD